MNSSLKATSIVGAGPVGCLAAILMARKGNPVTVFEADSCSRPRFAGEWLHPGGVRALERAGILSPDDAWGDLSHRGFVIFPDDGSEPIQLDYPEGDRGLVCEHGHLVDSLRAKAIAHERVEMISGARVVKVEKGRVEYHLNRSPDPQIHLTEHVVGADGRGSLVRPALNLSRSSKLISYMVGLMLHDVELPFPHYGHVILGAPGPILLYRVAPNLVRVSIDVPTELAPGKNHWQSLLKSDYAPHLPEELRRAFEQALRTESLQFRANRYRPRSAYGNTHLSLIGDAVGFQHPLTAMGMTLGFHDAEALAEANSFDEFRKGRRSMTLVPEMLSMTLYQAFSGRDPGAAEVRKAIYAMWRRYPNERERTMRLLAGEITSPVGFSISFLRGIQLALWGSVDADLFRFQWRNLSSTVGSIAQLLQEAAICSYSRFGKDLPMESASNRG
ncbi:MAG: FAD-dependent monooxygenase [Verrucomicrobiota bacterium]